MTGRLRGLLVLVLVGVLVGSTSSAAWALWTATGSTRSSVTNGKVSAAISGTEAITTTYSTTSRSVTRPVTLENAGNIPGTTATRTVVAGGSTPLAQAVDVAAWPVAAPADCTADAPVGPGAVRGTWAALPSLRSPLPAGASAVWCVRSVVTASAPTNATTDVHVVLTTSNATWVSDTVWGGFYLNTGTDLPTFTCADEASDHNYVELRWAQGGRPEDTRYAAFVGDRQVGDAQPGRYGRITLAPEQVTPSAGGATTVVVDIRPLDADGRPTTDVAGSGPVTLFTKPDAGPAIRCGA
ncbi:hypothetical protein [Curtobacterium sp. MCBD17_032]|uniref:hypothetical protein n=1 Tax=Curtobacterium sp. MCBD17_032 TaxID=2175659 RepID=UPI000DAA1749|nr:hypothetical protein [Curtobacterium sp. MCBD17_032]PZE85225.1 hypothetical protein DEI91_07335 [Curtobacterium sp. MCBD17_032]